MKLLSLIFFSFHLVGQTSEFTLRYNFGGLGSMQFETTYPIINISDNIITYTISANQNSDGYLEGKPKSFSTKFRQSSIDSIKTLIADIKDTLIYESNPCISSGGIHFILIKFNLKKLDLEFKNTFTYTGLKIAAIINNYIPKDKGIWATEEDVKSAENCWTHLRNLKSKTSKK